jgi:hypothetical protein
MRIIGEFDNLSAPLFGNIGMNARTGRIQARLVRLWGNHVADNQSGEVYVTVQTHQVLPGFSVAAAALLA